MIDLESIQETIDYSFENKDLLQQAFVRRSYSEENGGQNNEVLEFVGDKALDLAVARIMMERFGKITDDKAYNEFKLSNPKYFKTKIAEGQFTDIKKQLVQKKFLSRCIEKLGFHEQLILGKGDIKKNIIYQDSVKEDLFEAIVGAVAIDSDFDMESITEVVENMIDFSSFFKGEDDEFDNYVGKIQEWSQKQGYGLPKYVYHDKPWDKTYRCDCTIIGDDGFYCTESGEDSSKAKARMNAAYRMYIHLLGQEYVVNEFEEAVGEPIREESTRQVNELFQKKLIDKPDYQFYESHDNYGDTLWTCELKIPGYKQIYVGEAYVKKEAQRKCAYQFLCALMDYEYEDE